MQIWDRGCPDLPPGTLSLSSNPCPPFPLGGNRSPGSDCARLTLANVWLSTERVSTEPAAKTPPSFPDGGLQSTPSKQLPATFTATCVTPSPYRQRIRFSFGSFLLCEVLCEGRPLANTRVDPFPASTDSYTMATPDDVASKTAELRSSLVPMTAVAFWPVKCDHSEWLGGSHQIARVDQPNAEDDTGLPAVEGNRQVTLEGRNSKSVSVVSVVFRNRSTKSS